MKNNVILGDCLEVMPQIEDGSIDMILCDPPYGNMRGASLDGWSNQTTEWDTIIDTNKLFEQYNRILRMNGCLVMFSQEPYTSSLITNAHGNIPFSYRMIWLKDHFANALVANVAPVSYYEDIVVFFKTYDTTMQHPIRNYTKNLFNFIGKTKKELFQEMGHQGICHFMRYDSMQFDICTKKTYEQLCSLYGIINQEWFKSYEEIQEINKRFNKRFNLWDGKKFKSNVLQYKKDYRGEHPTQKPVLLFEDLIKTYTNEGDLVLDNCAGSGTTAIACINLNRNYILIEKEQEYIDIINKRIHETIR